MADPVFIHQPAAEGGFDIVFLPWDQVRAHRDSEADAIAYCERENLEYHCDHSFKRISERSSSADYQCSHCGFIMEADYS